MEVNLEDWTHRLYVLGELDQPRIAWLTHLTPTGGLFVDVGANVGLYTCEMARHLGEGGAVIAVEPFERSAELLRANIALNRLNNVEVIEAAASDSPGTLPLYEPPSGGLASSGHLRVVDPGGWVQVGSTPTVRLDELLGDRHIDAVKVDVEGHEMAVMEGLGSVIDRCRPILLCEAIVPEVINGLLAMREALGYLAFRDDGRGRLIPADSSQGDILLVPEERIEDARPLLQ
jgi:FkbM family methyltransferase